MPYREKKIRSGEQLEVEIYPITAQERKQTRAKKEKETVPKQKNLNDKNARKHLNRRINANFTDEDLALHLTYIDKYLPKNEKELRRDIENYLKRVKYHRKKNNLPPLKYIYVIEYREPSKGQKGIRMHIHLIMNNMDRDLAETLWKKGRVNTKRLQADEYGYEGLARYISKDPRGKKRWSSSKNLKQPDIKVNDYRFSIRKVDTISKLPEDRQLFEKLYPGYTFNDCKVTVNEITSKKYLYIRMRKIKDERE